MGVHAENRPGDAVFVWAFPGASEKCVVQLE